MLTYGEAAEGYVGLCAIFSTLLLELSQKFKNTENNSGGREGGRQEGLNLQETLGKFQKC